MKSMKIEKLSKEKFPPALLKIPQPPEKLFIIGELPPPNLIPLCVVGSRKFTSYGKECCEKLITGLKGYSYSLWFSTWYRHNCAQKST